MTVTSERSSDFELATVREELVALGQALREASDRLSHVRASALVATHGATGPQPAANGARPMNGATSTEASGLLESLDAEADRLRALLERRLLEAGCDPVHDDATLIAGATAAPGAPATTDPELLARLDALDAECDEVVGELLAGARDGNGAAPANGRTGTARTFRVVSPVMKGADIRAWQLFLNGTLADWRIGHAIDVDGDYGEQTSLWSKRVLRGLGLSVTDRVTPRARIKARHPRLRSAAEIAAARERRGWLERLRRRYERAVHTPVEGIITSSHGFSKGHDGIDLICPAKARIFAACRARVIDVRAGGWWGKTPTGDVARGDGIIQLEALESIGPLKKGMHIGYGHAEGALVKVGQVVDAGEVLGRAGFARAWHIHFMINDGRTIRGIGTLDPRPCLDLFTGRA